MNRLATTFMCGLFLLCMEISSFAQGPSFDLSVGYGSLSGDSTYQIGGEGYTQTQSWTQRFPTSELEFPTDVNMALIEGNLYCNNDWSLNVSLKKNLFDDDAGTMKDSDWGLLYNFTRDDFLPDAPPVWWPWSDPDSLDIYSESDAELDALIMDINIRKGLFKLWRLSVIAGIGYIYQNFDYEVSDLDQWYPSLNEYAGFDIGHDIIGGEVLIYEVTYKIPYMEIGVKCVNDKFSAEAFLGYSPEVDAEDKDQHLLRNLVSRSDCDGDAWLVSLHGRYNINLSWFVTLQADYIKIDTDGKSTSQQPGEEDITIYQEIESTQTFWSISVGYAFN